MTDTSTLAAKKSLAAASPQAQQSETHSDSDNANANPNVNANVNQWRALGYYAVGELSVGRTDNALYAYRLLCTLDPLEARWKLGRAFCALNTKRIAEAQKILEVFSLGASSVGIRQQTLLHRCQERLAYLQQQKAKQLIAPQPQSNKPQVRKRADSGKLIPFPQPNPTSP